MTSDSTTVGDFVCETPNESVSPGLMYLAALAAAALGVGVFAASLPLISSPQDFKAGLIGTILSLILVLAAVGAVVAGTRNGKPFRLIFYTNGIRRGRGSDLAFLAYHTMEWIDIEIVGMPPAIAFGLSGPAGVQRAKRMGGRIRMKPRDERRIIAWLTVEQLKQIGDAASSVCSSGVVSIRQGLHFGPPPKQGPGQTSERTQ